MIVVVHNIFIIYLILVGRSAVYAPNDVMYVYAHVQTRVIINKN